MVTKKSDTKLVPINVVTSSLLVLVMADATFFRTYNDTRSYTIYRIKAQPQSHNDRSYLNMRFQLPEV